MHPQRQHKMLPPSNDCRREIYSLGTDKRSTELNHQSLAQSPHVAGLEPVANRAGLLLSGRVVYPLFHLTRALN